MMRYCHGCKTCTEFLLKNLWAVHVRISDVFSKFQIVRCDRLIQNLVEVNEVKVKSFSIFQQ